MAFRFKGLFSKDNREKLLNLIYSVSAVAIFNMVIQLVIYPDFERRLGSDHYGVALSILSFVAITAGTCGYAVNCSRLLGIEKGYTQSGDYNLILLVMGLLNGMLGTAYLFYLNMATPVTVTLCFVLMFVTMLRYYSEVEFKINTNFFRYMIYYVLISAGYLGGLFLFHLSREWMLALIIGETLAILYVVACGSIYRPPFFKKTAYMKVIIPSIGFIFLSSLIDNISLHADRILLLAITGDGSAVTTYYVASLIGKIVSMLTLPINTILISYLVRYRGVLSKKIWLVTIAVAIAFGVCGFAGCMLVSPWLIRLLYPNQAAEVMGYLAPAVLGQIFYFVSGVLMIVLLRFRGEKKQLIFNTGYAVVFFASVTVGTILGGLRGFILCILLANALRFLAAILWGFMGAGKTDALLTDVQEQIGEN